MKKFLTAFNVLSRLVGVMAIALTLCVSPVHAQEEEPQEDTTGLFSPAEPPSDETVQAAAEDPRVVRYRFVYVDLAQLNPILDESSPDTIISFNLFPGATFEVIVTGFNQDENGDIILIGHVIDQPDGLFTFDIFSGHILIHFSTNRENYIVESVSNEIAIVQQMAIGSSINDSQAIVPPENNGDIIRALVGDDTGEQVDVMVLYTTASAGSHETIVELQYDIAPVIEYTNDVYINSGLSTRMNLVYLDFATGYDETGLSWEQVLDQLTTPGDGYLDDVQALRDLYQADLVVLSIDNDLMTDRNVCGIAWMPSDYFAPVGTGDFSPYAYSVVDNHACTYSIIAHETGHNFGANHDRWIDNTPGMYEFSHGYKVFIGGGCQYYTAMAYVWHIINGTYGECLERAPVYSSPDVIYDGYVMGVPAGQPNSADNVTTIRNTAPIVAQFRDGPNPEPSSAIGAYTTEFREAVVQWNNSPTPFIVEYFLERWNGSSWIPIAQLPERQPNYTEFVDTDVVCGAEYYYRVRARSGNGYSTYTEGGPAIPCSDFLAPVYSSRWITESPFQLSIRWRDWNTEEEYSSVERSDHGVENWIEVDRLPGNDWSPSFTTYTTQSGLICGNTYDFRLRDYREGYYSPPSAVIAIPIPCRTPLVPTDLLVTNISQFTANIQWNDPSDDVQLNEVNFNIEQQEGSGSYIPLSSIPGESTSYLIHGLMCNTNYTFRIQSTNSAGSSTWASVNTTTSTCNPPDQINDLTVQALSESEIRLSWTDVNDETAYYIERSMDGITWTQITEIEEDNISFVDSTLSSGTQYYYRIHSHNVNSSMPFPYSNTAIATTFSAILFVPIVQTP